MGAGFGIDTRAPVALTVTAGAAACGCPPGALGTLRVSPVCHGVLGTGTRSARDGAVHGVPGFC